MGRRSFCLAALLVTCIGSTGGTASAEPRRIAVPTPVEAFTRRSDVPSPHAAPPFLYLNRCSSGCTITGGNTNDATTHNTTIPSPGTYTVQEYANATGQTGAAADAEWNAIVQCVKEVYSPYGVTVVDTPPPAGTVYNEAIIAGRPQDIGLGADILGIAPLASDCSAQENVISFSFANHHTPTERVLNVCWTASQESAHAYGLDHQYVFSDGTSTCNDPTTYRIDCGGQKFFRNKRAKCGEMSERACRCGGTQNSHQQLLGIFGPGAPLTPPPTAQVVFPAPDSVVTPGFVTHVSAGSKRGIAKVELFLNGSRWAVLPGAGFGANGQLNPSTYTFYLPTSVPDGIIDITAIAHDDIGQAMASQTVTVTKGAPCTSDDACADLQTCDAGRCRWAAPVGELGEECGFDQYCKSWTCLETADGNRCSTECATDEPTSCPSGLECLATAEGTTNGVCWPIDGGGCCSVGGGDDRAWLHAGLALLVFVRLRRRGRR